MSDQCFDVRIAGSDVVFRCARGDNLLRAGLRAGVGLPYECNAGGCGSCKFELVSGEVDELWPDAPGLGAKDRQRGRKLACQCVPRSDCELRIRAAAEYVPAIVPRRFDVEFVARRPVTVDIDELRFRGDAPARFLPGQYALLELPGVGHSRAYSMSNAANDDGHWCFMVRRVSGGRVSNALFDVLRPGDVARLDAPLGLAHWRDGVPRDTVCIAGGSGLAPMIAVANAASARTDCRQATWLFYGGRGPADMPDLPAWLATPERVLLRSAVSVGELADAAQWTGERGYVHELVGRCLGDGLTAHEYYLAGPPPMIETTVRMLMLEHRVPAAQIHYDRFF